MCFKSIKCTLEVCVNVGADEQCICDLSLIFAVKLRKCGSRAEASQLWKLLNCEQLIYFMLFSAEK